MNLSQLLAIMPESKPHAMAFLDPLNDAMAEFEINTPVRQAMFLAQVAHESGQLQFVKELASGLAYTGRADLGNTNPAAIEIAKRYLSTPGPFWKGRGLIQLTGYDNAVACMMALGIDCIEHPEVLELPVNASRSAGWYWQTHGLNELADAGEFQAVTKKINGGLNGESSREYFWVAAKKVLL